MMLQDLMSVTETAKLAKVSEQTIYRWASVGFKGIVLRSIRVGKTLKISQSDLADFVRATSQYYSHEVEAMRQINTGPSAESRAAEANLRAMGVLEQVFQEQG